MKYLLLLILLSCAPRIQETRDNTLAHQCNMKNCYMTGYIYFRTPFEKDTDGYYYDMTHWLYPQFTPEQIEEYLWTLHEYGQ